VPLTHYEDDLVTLATREGEFSGRSEALESLVRLADLPKRRRGGPTWHVGRRVDRIELRHSLHQASSTRYGLRQAILLLTEGRAVQERNRAAGGGDDDRGKD